MIRFAPHLVSLLGILGLALGLTYLVMIGLAFTPGFDELTHFLVGESDLQFSYNFLLVLIPYFLLTAHLYFRTHLGLWMLDRGLVSEARGYVQDKQEASLVRSKREVAHHRLAMARVHACEGDYDAAWELLNEARRRGSVPRNLRGRWAHWTLEVALRREDAVGFSEVSDAIDFTMKDDVAASVWACRAEYQARSRKYSRFLESVENSKYARSSNARLAHARAVGALRMPERTLGFAEIRQRLIEARAELAITHPFLVPECEALEIYLEAAQKGVDFSGEARIELRSCLERADSRATHVVRSILRDADALDEEN